MSRSEEGSRGRMVWASETSKPVPGDFPCSKGIFPSPSQAVLPTGDQVFEHINPWNPFSLKPPHQAIESRHTSDHKKGRVSTTAECHKARLGAGDCQAPGLVPSALAPIPHTWSSPDASSGGGNKDSSPGLPAQSLPSHCPDRELQSCL